MNIIEELKEEHQKIRTLLASLELVTRVGSLDSAGLLFNLKSLYELWNRHEEKEEDIFPYLEKRGINVPVKELKFEHAALKGYWDKIRDALASGNELKIKEVVSLDLNMVIARLRAHMNKEDSVLYGVILDDLKKEDIEEIRRIAEKV